MRALISLTLMLLWACSPCDHACQLGLTGNEWGQFDDSEKESVQKWSEEYLSAFEQASQPAKTNLRVEVRLMEGTALMWPSGKFYSFVPTAEFLKSGECRALHLTSTNGEQSTILHACLNDRALHLDPCRYTDQFSLGSVIISRHPMWKQGLVYQPVISKGHSRFSHVNLFIQEV